MRCTQLAIPTDCAEMTTLSRACNTRRRLDPPLAPGYCGNAVCNVQVQLSVRELLSSSAGAIASKLRAALDQQTHDAIEARGAWLQQVQARGCTARQAFDAQALTFIVSSWDFSWEGACFGAGAGSPPAAPIAFDHGAIVPIVAVFTRRPKASDGLNVYASGPRESLVGFAQEMEMERGN